MNKSRFLLGAIGGWFEIGLILLINFLLVPIYLSNWSIEVYSAWILLISIWGISSMLHLGHSDFIYHKSLNFKSKIIKKSNIDIISSLPYALIISLIILIISYLNIDMNFISNLLKISTDLEEIWNISFFYITIVGVLLGSNKFFFQGPLAITGNFHIYVWSNFYHLLIISVVPGIAVLLGANFELAVKSLLIAEFVSLIFIYYFFIIILRKKGFKIYKPNFIIGLNNLILSLWTFLKIIVEFFNQTGIRFLVSAIYGPIILVYFSTIRTVANVLTQVLKVIGKPLLPELMYYVKNKKKQNVIAIFELIYLIILLLICPVAFFLQLAMPYFFELWTLGKITFDPFVYLILTQSIIFHALCMPAERILTGSNLYKLNFFFKLIIFLIMLFYIYLTHESLEIINVGIAILISEILLFMSSYILLLKYVIDIKFNWTMRKLFIPLTSVITTFIFSSLLAIDTLNITLIISIFVILQLFFSVLFYKKTSELTKIKILKFKNKIIKLMVNRKLKNL